MERRVDGAGWWRAALALGCCAWLGCQPAARPTPTPLTVTLSSAQVAVAADTSLPAPEASVTLQLSAAPDPAFALRVTHTREGLQAVALVTSDRTRQELRLHFRVPRTLIPGTYRDTVTVLPCADPTCAVKGTARTLGVTYEVTRDSRPEPAVIGSVSPRRMLWSDGPLSLTVNGFGFEASSVVLWNGQPRPTVLEDSTRLTAALSQADLIGAAHTVGVRVTRSGPDGGVSNQEWVEVFGPADQPALDDLVPSSMLAGSPGFVLTVIGYGFSPGATVLWSDRPLETTFVATYRLTAVVPAALLDYRYGGGYARVTVRNPGVPAGYFTRDFQILASGVPRLDSVSPVRLTVGSGPATLEVHGANFVSSPEVLWNETPLSTNQQTSGGLLASVPEALLRTVGTQSISVRQSGGRSGAIPLEVARGALDAVTMQVDPAHSGFTFFNAFGFPASASWTVDLGGVPSYALVAEGKVFVTVARGATSELVALDQATGSLAWGPLPLGGPASAAYEDGGVYVLTAAPGQPATVRAFQASSGASRWSTSLGVLQSLPPGLTATGGLVYPGVDGPGGLLRALFAEDGGVAWTAAGPFPGAGSAPAVADGVLYTRAAGCGLYDGDPVSGVLASHGCWYDAPAPGAFPVVGGGFVVDCPALGDGSGFLPNDAGTGLLPSHFCRISRAPGREPLFGLTAAHPPAAGPHGLYFADMSGTLRAMTPSSSWEPRWTYQLPDRDLIRTIPLGVNHYVFIGAGQTVSAIDTFTGQRAWSALVPAPIPPPHDGGAWAPLTGLSAGHGLLLVPAGTTLTAFTLSTDP